CPKFVINDWLTHLLGPSVTMAKVNRMLKKLTALGLFLKPSLKTRRAGTAGRYTLRLRLLITRPPDVAWHVSPLCGQVQTSGFLTAICGRISGS
ncbi:hypothetical protein KTE51_29765, partial [Burkholderia multivorans]|nr:hypothetical protein [Burkholderia multivorans]